MDQKRNPNSDNMLASPNNALVNRGTPAVDSDLAHQLETLLVTDSTTNDDDLSPMHKAAKHGDAKALIGLFQEGYTAHHTGFGSYLPLELAFKYNHKYCAYLLFHHGGIFLSENIFDGPEDPYSVIPELQVLSLISVVNEKYMEQSIVEKNGYQNLVLDENHMPLRVGRATIMDNSHGYSDLVKAILKGDDNLSHYILEKSPESIHEKGPYGLMPIHWAALNCKTDMIDLLIQAGADPNATTDDQLTPLHFAAFNTSLTIRWLKFSGATNLNPKAKNGWTPRHVAAYYHQTDTENAFVEEMVITRFKYDRDDKTDSGKTCSDLENEYKERRGLGILKQFLKQKPLLLTGGPSNSQHQSVINQPLLTNDGTSNDNDNDDNCFSYCRFY